MPAIAAVVSFIDCINRGDVDGLISPHQLAEREGRVAVLGRTTGSHLGLRDEQEERLTVIWVAHVEPGRLRLWRIVEDREEHRNELDLEAAR